MNKNMMRKIAIGIFSLTIIIVFASFFVANQVDNDTWDDTHWGGDTGEEEYSVSDDDTTNGTDEFCNTGICTSIILFGSVLLPSCIKYWKKEDDE